MLFRSRPFFLNKVGFIFSDDGEDHMHELIGDEWSEFAYHNVMIFRTVTLRYRATEYFQALLSELKKSRKFRRYWREACCGEEDHFIEARQMVLNSSEYGSLDYFPAYFTAPTTAGELHLCMYVPASRRAAAAFWRAVDETGPGTVFRIGSWPKKTLMWPTQSH